MRYSRLFIPTLKEAPAEAEAVSHKLMVRGGFVRQLAAGLYIYLPLGQRVMDKIDRIIREEMNAIGGQEVTMPVLHPAEVWQQTGRWDAIGDEMFRLKDRSGRDMCLAMTHEEIMTWLAAHDLAVVPRPAADLVPVPDQTARRGASQERYPAHARVRHEGLLQL